MFLCDLLTTAECRINEEELLCVFFQVTVLPATLVLRTCVLVTIHSQLLTRSSPTSVSIAEFVAESIFNKEISCAFNFFKHYYCFIMILL